MTAEEDFETLVLAELETLLSDYGDSISVWVSKAVAKNIYGQSKLDFEATAISCTGRCILNPSPEELSIVGNMEDVDAAVLFSRAEMVSKFPSNPENEWISLDDEVEYDSIRYRIIKVYPTGRIKDYCAELVLLCKDKKAAT